MSINKTSQRFTFELRSKTTDSERLFQIKLEHFKIKHIFQYSLPWGKSFIIVDFYIPDYGVIVEIDDGYHYSKEMIAQDRIRDEFLNECGYSVIRIDNENVDKFDTISLKQYKKGEIKESKKTNKKREKLDRAQKRKIIKERIARNKERLKNEVALTEHEIYAQKKADLVQKKMKEINDKKFPYLK
jgi:very-short-patch-repair endonuclease